MRRIFTILACGLILGPISAGVAQAQIDDHLKCYKIKDDLSVKAYKGFVDLDSAQFGLEPGCKITKAKLFCVPVTKSNVQRPKATVDLLPIFGPPAPGDRICYKVKCAGPLPPDTTASDQFGTHNLTGFKAFMLCTPATKIFPPLCDQSGYPTCAGDCPDPNQTCHPADDGTTRCLCDEQCGFDAQGICGGDCPDPQVCDLVFDSADPNIGIPKDCQCLPKDTDPVLCEDTFPQCNGPCPNPDDDCVLVDTGTPSSPVIECRCEPSIEEPLCEDTLPVCDGGCPNANEECVVVFDLADPQNPMPIDCRCEPTEPLCGDTFPACDGGCPEPDVCITSAEQCDDGNLSNTDTCCNDCTGPPCDPLLDPPLCVGGGPNGLLESDCICDGCVPDTNRCQTAGVVGASCSGAANQLACEDAGGVCFSFDCNIGCGNGTLELFCCEECDDGNIVGGDGCSASCQAE